MSTAIISKPAQQPSSPLDYTTTHRLSSKCSKLKKKCKWKGAKTLRWRSTCSKHSSMHQRYKLRFNFDNFRNAVRNIPYLMNSLLILNKTRWTLFISTMKFVKCSSFKNSDLRIFTSGVRNRDRFATRSAICWLHGLTLWWSVIIGRKAYCQLSMQIFLALLTTQIKKWGNSTKVSPTFDITS